MDLSQVEEKLKSIELRLSKLEGGSSVPTTPTPATTASAIQPSAVKAPPDTYRPAFVASTDSLQTQTVVTPTKPGNWLGVIAILCFVLAAGFIIKLSIESGWLTPGRQIGLAVLFGFSLIGTGFKLLNSDREYASLLPAAGTIVLYLSAFAAHRLYSLISFEVAIASTALVSGLCVWLYSKIKHDVYALTAAIGSYVSPIMLGIDSGATFSLYYFLLCSVAFSAISILVESRMLTLISAYLAILVSGYIGMNLNQDVLVVTVLGLHFLIFALGQYIYTDLTRKPLSENESGLLLPVLLIFYAMEYYYINRVQPGLAPWVSMGFAAVLLGLYISAKKWFPKQNLSSGSIILTFATLVGFHSVYLELLPSEFRPWLFPLILMAWILLPDQGPIKKGNPFQVPLLGLMAILAIEYFTMVAGLVTNKSDFSMMAVSLVSFVCLWIALIFGNEKITGKKDLGLVILGCAHLLAIMAFYRLTEDIGSLAVSASWLFYALAVVIFAFNRKDEIMAKSAIFVLAFAAAKALLYDVSQASAGVRIFCLLLTGAALYGSGFLMRKISGWKN